MKPDGDLKPTSSHSELYGKYFSVIEADNPELLDAAHALRYQVYCVDHAFEDPTRQSGDRERDTCDLHSVHSVLISKPTGNVVGCVRLILPRADGPCPTLPIRTLLSETDRARLDALGPSQTAEISRYAIAKQYRRRAGESLYPDVSVPDPLTDDFRRLLPHMSVGLIRGVCLLAVRYNIKAVCAEMSPPLLRLLERFGLVFQKLGPVIDYHGPRQPCVAECRQLLAGLAERNNDIFQLVAKT